MQARAAIYLDANAGAPLSEAARAALFSLLCESRAEVSDLVLAGSDTSARALLTQESGEVHPIVIPNPSSSHAEGRMAKALLRQARAQVASSLGGVSPDELVFVSSGTEASQMAIRSVLEPKLLLAESPHWILTAGDHDAHHQMVSWIRARGGSVSVLPLCANGAPDLDGLEKLFTPATALVSAIWVNNETGVLTDVARLSSICAARRVPLHLDGAQAWGKLPITLPGLADLASFSGHKIGGLSGTGVLWRATASARAHASSRSGALFPGKQESGWRGGTENLVGAIALGAAAAALDPQNQNARLEALRDRMENEIVRLIPGTRIHGKEALRAGNTSNLGFEGVEKDGLVAALDLAGYCVSPGSACSSGIVEPSHVLLAMGLGAAEAKSAVRVSLSASTTWAELEGFAAELTKAVERARRSQQGRFNQPLGAISR